MFSTSAAAAPPTAPQAPLLTLKALLLLLFLLWLGQCWEPGQAEAFLEFHTGVCVTYIAVRVLAQ